MNKDLYIVGAGSVGGHICSNLELYNLTYENIYFIDNDSTKINTDYMGCRVIGDESLLCNLEQDSAVIIGLAAPRIKSKIFQQLKQNAHLEFPKLIAKNAWISKDVEIGIGTIVYPHTSINFGTKIGDFVTINMNCAIGHQAYIQDFSSLAPGVNIGGHTRIGVEVEMGIGSTCVQGIEIGDHTIVGGQAMLTKSFENNLKIVGVPGRNI